MEGERLIGGTTNMRGPAAEKERERARADRWVPLKRGVSRLVGPTQI
jgi:hypothetical protein